MMHASIARTLLILLWLPALLVAAEPGQEHDRDDSAQTAAETTHQGRSARHHRGVHHRNHLALFLGNAHKDGEDGFAIGGDYEYRLNRFLGVGGQVDYTEKFHSLVVTFPVFFHPFGGLRLLAAPGVDHEFESEEGEAVPEMEMEAGLLSMEPEVDPTKFVFRLGVFYDFFIGRFTITPTFEIDIESGTDAKVFGVSLGYEF